jgi:hypothetical protein
MKGGEKMKSYDIEIGGVPAVLQSEGRVLDSEPVQRIRIPSGGVTVAVSTIKELAELPNMVVRPRLGWMRPDGRFSPGCNNHNALTFGTVAEIRERLNVPSFAVCDPPDEYVYIEYASENPAQYSWVHAYEGWIPMFEKL